MHCIPVVGTRELENDQIKNNRLSLEVATDFSEEVINSRLRYGIEGDLKRGSQFRFVSKLEWAVFTLE